MYLIIIVIIIIIIIIIVIIIIIIIIKQMYKYSGSAVQLNIVGSLFFADDLVGMGDSSGNLQKLIDVVHKFCNQKVNVSKCAVVVLSKSKVPGI